MYKVAIIGLGKFGQKRLKTCLDLEDHLDFVGVVDINQKTLKSIKEKFNLPVFSNHEKMLFDLNPDLVIVSTPPKFHKDIVLDCLRSGAHVLCEKPLSLSSRDSLIISKASKKYQRFVKLGSNHRFFPNVSHALNLIKQNKIGEVLSMRASIGNDGSLSKNSWFWNKSVAGGGTLIDNGSHIFDLFRQIMGDFDCCLSHATTHFWKDAEVEDHATAILVNKKNQQAVITSSWTKWYGYFDIEIWGKNGFILIQTNDEDIVKIGLRNKNKSVKTIDFSNEPHNSYHQEILYFLNCIKHNKQPSPNADDGYNILRIIEAVYKSNSLGKKVKI